MIDSRSNPLPYEVRVLPEVDVNALGVLGPEDRGTLMRDLATFLLDGQMRRLAAGRGVLDLRLGTLLRPMLEGEFEKLGFVKLDDYAREKLGMTARSARTLVQRARALEERPALRDAVIRGEVSGSQVDMLLGAPAEADAAWVERARELTVEGLKAALQAQAPAEEVAGYEDPDARPDGEWRHYRLPATHKAFFEMTRELAFRVGGAEFEDWQVLEYLAADYLAGAEPAPFVPSGTREEENRAWRKRWQKWMRELRKDLEVLSRCWEFFDWSPVQAELAPELRQPEPQHPHLKQILLDKLILCRNRLGLHLGRMLRTFHNCNLWRDAMFTSIYHYAQERLGLSRSATAQHLARERKLLVQPELYQALLQGRLPLSHADVLLELGENAPMRKWITHAETTTCRRVKDDVRAVLRVHGLDPSRGLHPPAPGEDLPRHFDEERERREREIREEVARELAHGEPPEDVQTFSLRRRMALAEREVRSTLSVWVPDDVLPVLREAEAAARAAHGADLTPEQCLFVWMDDFWSTWARTEMLVRAAQRRLFAREGWRCAVPGCTCRKSLHRHHIRYRSQGGGDEDWALVVLCARHHLAHQHGGLMRVTGRAPHGLVFELGFVEGVPYEVYRGETRVERDAA